MEVLVLLALSGLNSWQPVIDDHFATLELSHVYDRHGKHQFSQWIWWSIHDDEQSHVHDWRLRKDSQRLVRRQGRYVLIFFEDDLLRRVTADTFKESWTQFDPEIDDRRFVPPNLRQGLTRNHCHRQR